MSDQPLIKVDRILEKEHAVIDGIDISGRWNRMFSQRSITEYPTEAMDWITGLDGGESLRDCYQCGKCVPVCPVQHVGSYGPRKLHVKVLRGNNLIDDPDLWLCTTCGNCFRVCPKEVNPLQIMPAIREQAVLQGKVPDELAQAFANLQRQGNPQGESPRKRVDWAAEAGVPVPLIGELGRPVDVLWYVSDYTSYHPRGKDAARAMARVLTALGVDFAILGPEERSDGDSARLAGETGLFELLAEQNIKAFGKYAFARLVVMDPHAYNAFRNHYPRLGWTGEVLHYTQFLAEHVSERLSERRVREAVATVGTDGSGVLSVACPYEPSRFEDAVKSTGNDGRIVVRDIIELIDQAMQPLPATTA